ncbi:hypothetical protein TNCV_3626331 [Trichonephila clavipes]|nr:hypothetical protein TNCV_3626331 [Trichonephila clavipes]
MMSDLSEGKRGIVIRARLAGTDKRGVLKDHCVKRYVSLHTNPVTCLQRSTTVEPSIHQNYSTGVASCEHSWSSSYSKTISFCAKCYEGTIVVQRPPKLDIAAIRTSYLD